MTIHDWMCWTGGVDVAGSTDANAAVPNVIVHVARRVETPIGATAAGLVFIQPNRAAAPLAFGFVCEDERIGAYFGPSIFAGTPFEGAPVLRATIAIIDEAQQSSATVRIGAMEIVATLDSLGPPEAIHRAPGPMPFVQQGIERVAGRVSILVDGRDLKVSVPAVGLSGGPGAVVTPCGVYAR